MALSNKQIRASIPAGHIGAVSLWQPYGTLVMVGAKQYETRGWSPPPAWIGTRIAIHSTIAAGRLDLSAVTRQAMRNALRHSRKVSPEAVEDFSRLPRGYVLGTARLEAVALVLDDIKAKPSYSDLAASYVANVDVLDYGPKVLHLRQNEHHFGDWRPGRWVWQLADPRPFPTPMRIKQGWQRVGYWNGPVCAMCGCTEHDACPGRCSWAGPQLCSGCVI